MPRCIISPIIFITMANELKAGNDLKNSNCTIWALNWAISELTYTNQAACNSALVVKKIKIKNNMKIMLILQNNTSLAYLSMLLLLVDSECLIHSSDKIPKGFFFFFLLFGMILLSLLKFLWMGKLKNS